jgi:hypothetical protein
MAANYQQPEYVEKRLRYFDGQFLKDQDFIDEQQYHIDRQRRLSKILQVSGICLGLDVTAKGVDQAILAPGAAVDAKGRLIVLGAQEVIALATYKNKIVNLFVSYQEIEAERATEGSEGNRRWHEKPLIAVVAEGDPDPQESVKLAKLSVDKDGLVKVDSTVRQYSGVYLPAGGGNGPTLRSGGDSASNLAVLTGDLNVTGSVKVSGTLSSNNISLGSGSITAGSATISGNLTTNGNVGIGTASPTEKLEVAGNIKASGSITAAGATISGALTAGTFTVNSLSVGSGGITTTSGTLNFGSTTVRQMINLWVQDYGIGVQNNTQYFRTAQNYAWYKGGSHNDGELNAGTGGTVQMAIKDGNVGIGTNSPEALLTLMGNRPTSGSDSATQELLKISRMGPTQVGAGGSKGSHFSIGLSYYENPSLHYPRTRVDFKTTEKSTDNTTTPKTVMSLRDDGNVGIGTITPSEKLEVAGNIKASGSLTAAGATISGNLSFGSTTLRQMINLWNEGHGIGVQNATHYFRTYKNYAWYKGGSHDDGELNAGTGGTVQMVIKDGNVGIGTNSPEALLNVMGNRPTSGSDSATQELLKISRMGPTQVGAGGSKGSHFSIGLSYYENPSLHYPRTRVDFKTTEKSTDNTTTPKTVMSLRDDGNVGIGTITPSEKLEVAGNIKASGSLTAAGATISGNLSFGSTTLRQMINLWNEGHGIGVQNATHYFRTYKNYAWYKGGSHDDGELNAGTGGTVQMVIKDGNVGIGTNSPGAKLDVNGIIQTYNKDNSSATHDNIQIWSEGEKSYIQTNGDQNGFWLKSNTGGKIILDSNVGIGTANPTEKLEVAGNLKVSGSISFNQKPFQVVRYTNIADNPRYKTTYKTSEWGAIIAGYNVSYTGGSTSGMSIYMAKTSDGYWQITGDIVGVGETWPEIYVMFIKSSWIDMP